MPATRGAVCTQVPCRVNASSTRQEHQSELADLDFVAVGQQRLVHGYTVDVGGVEAAEVDDPECAVLRTKFGVAAADGHLVEEDVADGMATCGCDGLVQQELRAGVGPALDDEQACAARQTFDRGGALGVGRSRRGWHFAEIGAESGGSFRHDDAPLVVCKRFTCCGLFSTAQSVYVLTIRHE